MKKYTEQNIVSLLESALDKKVSATAAYTKELGFSLHTLYNYICGVTLPKTEELSACLKKYREASYGVYRNEACSVTRAQLDKMTELRLNGATYKTIHEVTGVAMGMVAYTLSGRSGKTDRIKPLGKTNRKKYQHTQHFYEKNNAQ